MKQQETGSCKRRRKAVLPQNTACTKRNPTGRLSANFSRYKLEDIITGGEGKKKYQASIQM
jgi:hypothetical protein